MNYAFVKECTNNIRQIFVLRRTCVFHLEVAEQVRPPLLVIDRVSSSSTGSRKWSSSKTSSICFSESALMQRENG